VLLEKDGGGIVPKPRGLCGRGDAISDSSRLISGLLNLKDRHTETPRPRRAHGSRYADTPSQSSRYGDSPLPSHGRPVSLFNDTIRYPDIASWFKGLDARPACALPGVSWDAIGSRVAEASITQLNILSLMPSDYLEEICGNKTAAIVLHKLAKEEMHKFQH
jgi:hypothetical protein